MPTVKYMHCSSQGSYYIPCEVLKKIDEDHFVIRYEDIVTEQVEEETGLKVDSIEPIGLWESCYPTDGIECIENGIGLKGHYLVIFCRCKMKDNSEDGNVKLRLQEEEIEGAVWLGSHEYSSCNTEVAMLDVIYSDGKKNQQISVMDLCGIYPYGDSLTGLAQGHLFMIEEYFSRRSFL